MVGAVVGSPLLLDHCLAELGRRGCNTSTLCQATLVRVSSEKFRQDITKTL